MCSYTPILVSYDLHPITHKMYTYLYHSHVEIPKLYAFDLSNLVKLAIELHAYNPLLLKQGILSTKDDSPPWGTIALRALIVYQTTQEIYPTMCVGAHRNEILHQKCWEWGGRQCGRDHTTFCFGRKNLRMGDVKQYTHTHTQRERERERHKEVSLLSRICNSYK